MSTRPINASDAAFIVKSSSQYDGTCRELAQAYLDAENKIARLTEAIERAIGHLVEQGVSIADAVAVLQGVLPQLVNPIWKGPCPHCGVESAKPDACHIGDAYPCHSCHGMIMWDGSSGRWVAAPQPGALSEPAQCRDCDGIECDGCPALDPAPAARDEKGKT